MKNFVKILVIVLVSLSVSSMDDGAQLRKIRVSHPDGSFNFMTIYTHTPWDELQDLVFNMFPDYREYSALCAAKQIDWQVEDLEQQREMIRHIHSQGTEIVLLRRINRYFDLYIAHPIRPLKYITVNRDITWQELKDKIQNAFDDYEEFSASCGAKNISWGREDEPYQQEMINHICYHQTINLTERTIGGNI